MNRLLPGFYTLGEQQDPREGRAGGPPARLLAGLKGLEGQAAPGCGGEHSRAQQSMKARASSPWAPRQAGAHHLHTLHKGQPHGTGSLRKADHAGRRVGRGLQQRHHCLHAHLAALNGRGW